MPDDLMRYDLLAQNALRGVVREALRVVEKAGLPGEHHFYIAFLTKHQGVNIGERLAARYPREMTIVLQHQYYGLKVTDEYFDVELQFDNIPEKLHIPFAAVKGFLDPAVQFGLQFEVAPAVAEVAAEPKPKTKPKPMAEAKATEPAPDTKSPEAVAQVEAPKIVSLDSFRKK